MDIVYASTGVVAVGGVNQAMEFMVSIILGIAAVALVGIIAWRGVHFAAAHERQHVGEWLIGLGFGGGLIAGSRIIAQTLTGFAAGAPTVPEAYNASIVGFVLGDAIRWCLFFLLVHAVHLSRRRHHGHD